MMEENNFARLGGSLPVPSVQELAKGSPENVPPRYLRHDQQLPIIIKSDDNIPIINMESLLLGDEFEFKKLDSACKEWGFFQLDSEFDLFCWVLICFVVLGDRWSVQD
ncbi:hypothetical protein CQW23_31217 [Capsicum baccatum]|uniref:Non-haem dioxygenase N-terminal domain-containing protein n=1 Tax=Capsicum baccatum TaxID=33114 RepID=A0A2G2V898_CAPBA|nr:hypothetical protein CQW23_31217 [Capsicum baccatum]